MLQNISIFFFEKELFFIFQVIFGICSYRIMTIKKLCCEKKSPSLILSNKESVIKPLVGYD